MPSLNGRHDGRQILLPIAILASDNPADLTHVRAVALLDTGATTSGIAPSIVEGLDLSSYEKRRLVVATEDRIADYYLFRIGLFPDDHLDGGLSFVFAETLGFGIRPTGSFDMILGMDVLRQCDLRVDRSRNWQLDFG